MRTLQPLFFAAICLSLFWNCSSDSSPNKPNNADVSSSSFGDSDILPSSSSSPAGAVIKAGQTHLGYGYDVINSFYINKGDVKASPILDQEKMIEDALLAIDTIKGGEHELLSFVGNSPTAFYQDRNSGIDLPYNGVLFSGKYDTEFHYDPNASDKPVLYFRQISHRYTQEDYIKGTITAQKLSDYLTEDFANDLQAKPIGEILDKYGTHVLARYYKGGSMEWNLNYRNKDGVLSSLSSQEILKTTLKYYFEKYSGIDTTSCSMMFPAYCADLEQNGNSYYYTFGGNRLEGVAVKHLFGPNYREWVESIDSKAEICWIDDFSNSFVPLWEIVAVVNYSKAKELENEFNARVTKQVNALKGN